MPTPAYMSIIGEKQGNITKDANTLKSIGNTWQEDHKDEFLVQEFQHIATVPCNPQNGQPAGGRIFKPLIVTKRQDCSSPLIFNALVTGEKLTSCKVRFYQTNTNGKVEHYYTINLIDALLIDMRTRMLHAQDTATKERVVEEILQFSYRAIEVKHDICSTSGADDWRKPPV